MYTVELRGCSHPVVNDNNKWIHEFTSSDPTKPSIKIETIYIDPSSDIFDSAKNYIGLIVYLRHGKSPFTLNGVTCRTGDIYIKEVDWIENNVLRRKGRGNYYHGRLFHSIFRCWKKKKLEFVGGGFTYRDGKLIFNSGTLNTMNPNNNDDGYHNTDRKLNEFEEELIRNVFDNLYRNHRWLKLPPDDRVGLKRLNEIKLENCGTQCQSSADFSKVHADRKLHGTVIKMNYKSYGFIECIGFDEDVLVHCSDGFIS
jgi:hypothetical protein